MLVYILIVVGAIICAFQAIRSGRLLISAIWLAGCSALVALLIYLLGAAEIAVIELSVGAGLVTVLFVFAINITGDETLVVKRLIPRPVTWTLIVLALLLMGWMVLPYIASILPSLDSFPFNKAVWESRSLDVLLQVVLIFSGVLGLLGLMAEGSDKHHNDQHPGNSPESKI